VEVQERVRPPGEVAALALPQLRELAQLRQQWLQAIKIFVRGVPHTSSIAPGTRRRNSGVLPYGPTCADICLPIRYRNELFRRCRD
jgi:hypothetical protein